MPKEQTLTKALPTNGVKIDASAGNALTKIHLDLGKEGISLSMVGAASAVLSKTKKRHSIELKPTKEGITLSIVGAANLG